MNLLVTGALGHIGSGLIENVTKIKKLKNIYLLDSARSNNLNVLFNLRSKKIKFKFLFEDLCSKNSLRAIDRKIDVVVHLAAITNSEQSFKNKNLIFRNNFGIFKRIVNFCQKNNAKLIHLSSTSVYGQSTKIVDENYKNLEPRSPYAEEKLMEEYYLKSQKKMKFITFRLGTISGISKGMRFHTAVNKFCLNTILGQEIPVWTNALNQQRPYCSLKDALNAIIKIINYNGFDNQTYNVLTKNYTVGQILNMIKSNKFKFKIKKTNTPILNQSFYGVSNKKFSKFKIKMSKGIEKDITETLNMLKKLY
jgi:UDP-glucose 4-epimerase